MIRRVPAACRATIGMIRGLTRPFTVLASAGGPVFAALAYDTRGSYELAFYVFIGTYVAAAAVILVTPCPEGTSAQHPELTQIGYVPVETTEELVRAGKLDKAVAGNLLLGRRLLERGETVLVAPGISQDDTTAMGFLWAPDPQAALEMAFAHRGARAKVNVLHRAAKMVCVA